MSARRIPVILAFLTICSIAVAQNNGFYEKSKGRIGVAGRSGTEIMMDPKMGTGTIGNPNFKNYSDDSLEDLGKQMKEREWGREDTAWNRAREIDTRQAYEKYMAMYPNGAHISEATCKLIEAKIDETLRNAHNDLPNIKHIESDESSLTSTIVFKNNTGMPLTIYYSGEATRSFLIPPDGSHTISVTNGPYKLAASVPPSYIRPFAGSTEFVGGSYEMGFWIVTR